MILVYLTLNEQQCLVFYIYFFYLLGTLNLQDNVFVRGKNIVLTAKTNFVTSKTSTDSYLIPFDEKP